MRGVPDNFTVEVNFEGVGDDVMIFGDATRGKFGDATFGGSGTFVDVTEFVRSGSITRGTNRFEGIYGRAEAGSATVVLSNLDARFDPTNLSGPYVVGGVSLVRPMVAWRIRADGHDLWRGFVDSWDLDYPAGGKDAVCVLRGTDGTKVLANYNGAEQGAQGAGETTGARIERVLDNAGWPDADRDIATGLLVVEPTTLAQPAWTEILLTSDTEIGEVYFDGTGKLVFRDQQAIMLDTRSTTSQGTFTDDGVGLGYTDIKVATDDTLLANEVRIDGPGVTEQVVEDTPSQALFLKRSFVRTDLLMRTDAVALAYAEYALYLLKDVELRFDSITLVPGKDPDALFPHALGRELGDRITVEWTPPGRAEAIERDVFVRGITHEFTPATWSTRWTLQDATKFDYLIIDHPERGILGANRVAF